MQTIDIRHLGALGSVPRQSAANVLESLLYLMSQQLHTQGYTEVAGLGRLELVEVGGNTRYNPKTMQYYTTDKSLKIKFTPAKELLNNANKTRVADPQGTIDSLPPMGYSPSKALRDNVNSALDKARANMAALEARR